MTRDEAVQVAETTQDAYYADAYKSWVGCALMLRGLGYDAREAEAILRSKLARWAGDSISKGENIPTSALKNFVTKYPDAAIGSPALAQLVTETFA
jgi:hypothetical protein